MVQTSTYILLLQTANAFSGKLQGENLLKPKTEIVLTPRVFTNNNGVFVAVIMALALIAWLTYFQKKRVWYVLNAFFTLRYFKQLVREDSILQQRVFLIMTILFILILPFYLFLTLRFFHIPLFGYSGFLLYLICLFAIACMYFVKAIFSSFLAWLLQTQEQVYVYFYNIFLTNNFLAIAMLPIIVIIAYGSYSLGLWGIKIGAIFIILSFLYRTIRNLLLAINFKGISIYHLFLYFCTLEILPIMVLYKLIVDNIK